MRLRRRNPSSELVVQPKESSASPLPVPEPRGWMQVVATTAPSVEQSLLLQNTYGAEELDELEEAYNLATRVDGIRPEVITSVWAGSGTVEYLLRRRRGRFNR